MVYDQWCDENYVLVFVLSDIIYFKLMVFYSSHWFDECLYLFGNKVDQSKWLFLKLPVVFQLEKTKEN